jgi:signal peptidase I
MDILKYIPYTPARRRYKLLNDLKSRRHYDDDLLSQQEKEAFDRAISQLENAPAGKKPEQEAVKACSGFSKRGTVGDWLDLFLVVGAVAFGLRALYFQPFRIPTSSMQPTLYGIHYVDRDHAGMPLLGKVNKVVDALLYTSKKAGGKVVEPGRIAPESLRYDSGGLFGSTEFSIAGCTYDLPGDPAKVVDYARLDPASEYKRGDALGDGFITLGDHLFVERFSVYLTPLKRGDVIVFTTEDLIDEAGVPVVQGGYFYIKRLAALPGDTVRIVDDQLWVKPAGTSGFRRIQDISEQFKKIYSGKGGYHGHLANMGAGAFSCGGEYTVPAGHYFMLGDNSRFSKDSRFFGAVPRRNIMGRAFLVFWPFSRRFGVVDSKEALDIPTGEAGVATFPVMSKQ